jgi:SNF2 family DNA or RNA helicase
MPDDLFQYQKEDVDRICNAQGNFLNLSEMGVGKTPTSLGVVEKMGYKCVLILCPNSLKLEWKRQIEEWIGEDQVAVSSQDCYLRLEPIFRSLKENKKYKIINYETLRNKEHTELLKIIPWDCIILDEIHKLRNPDTVVVRGKQNKWTREMEGGIWNFLSGLKNKDCKIIGLSGSPIMNYPGDLYVPLSIVNSGKYPRRRDAWKTWMSKYCLLSDGRWGYYVYGTRNMNELRAETGPYIIRHTKKEVLPFLPDKMYKRVPLQMDTDQRKLYDQMEDELKVLLDTGEPLWSTSVLSTLTRLRQINVDPKILGVSASSAKTDFLMDLVEDMLKPEGEGQKLVVFSCFERYIYLLSTIFFKDINHVRVTGQESMEERAAAVKKFQEDPDCKLFLGTIQTAGEGITLTAASTVVLADRWWNQPTCNQAIDRLHRIGQKNSVEVLYPICEDSVDATLDAILQKKEEVSQEYYSETRVRQSVFEDRLGGKK